jgi:REP element-mobilizing transposase RayT
MSSIRRTTTDDIYFVTLTLMGWIDLFTRDCYKKIIVENLEYCRKNESLEIFEYVIMSNHLHMIVRRRGADLNELLGRFKSFTAKKLIKEIQENVQESRKEWILHQFKFFATHRPQYSNYHVWNYENYPINIDSDKVFKQKRDYIHKNPVRAGIVTNPIHYLYSSACPDSPLRLDPA